ncbi:hypothetical protein [Streptomyces sp. NPDC102409]|uniref:hypothetical protein n=1 Tax=Streptomyces sp. NPDC102409 TaxID=3366172 RepID=UPI0038279187
MQAQQRGWAAGDRFGFAVQATGSRPPRGQAAGTAASTLGVDLICHRIAPGDGALTDVRGRRAEAYGVGAVGVVLARPDGVVAWHTREGVTLGEQGWTLEAVSRTVLAR